MSGNSTNGEANTSPRAYLAACTVALLAAASPIILFPIPPLFDYPGHLARQGIIHDLLTSGAFSAMYQLHIAVIPNLGIEAIVLPLLFLGIPLEIAGRIFLALLVTLLGIGVINLHRALFQKTSYFPLLSLAFIFNPVLMYGFVNYVLGIAVTLNAFAWWLRARQRPVSAILPILLSWAVALFICHLMAAIFFVGLIASYEASLALVERYNKKERSSNFPRALLLLGILVALLAFLYRLTPLIEAPRTDVYSLGDVLQGVLPRLKALPHYLSAYSRLVDVTVVLALAGMLGLSAWFRWLRVSLPMLTPIFGLLLLYAVVPDQWAGTYYISFRLPIVAIFLFFSSVDIVGGRQYLQATVVMGILALRTITALIAWSKANAEYQPILQAIAKLPAHSAIYTGVNYRESFEPLVQMPWSHLDAYAAIRNRLFVREIWADPTQNWIIPTPKYSRLSKLKLFADRVDRPIRPNYPSDMFDPALLANHDFLLAVQPELYRRPVPTGIRLIVRSGNAALFSLHNR